MFQVGIFCWVLVIEVSCPSIVSLKIRAFLDSTGTSCSEGINCVTKGLIDGDAEDEGLRLGDETGLEGETDAEGLGDAEGERDAEGLPAPDGEIDADGERDADGLPPAEGEAEGLRLADGEREADGLTPVGLGLAEEEGVVPIAAPPCIR